MQTIEGGWARFKEAISGIAKENYDLLYRGQCNSAWGLTSSWHRIAPGSNPSLYWPLLRQVLDHVTTWSNQAWDLDNNEDVASFLGFLQHHGFPTPLVDWTMSPYIASFFGFAGVDERNPQCDSIAVYAFDHRTYVSDWKQVYELNAPTPHVSVLQAFSRGNQKQILQQGLYTFSNVADQEHHIISHEAAAAARRGEPATYLWKYIMSVKEKPLAMRELRLMGINAMTLFPSIEGVCRYLKDMYFSPSTVGQTPGERMQEMFRLMAERKTEESEPDLFEQDQPPKRADDTLGDG